MSADYIIRPAQADDAPEMARLAAQLGYPMPTEEMRRRLESLLSGSHHYVAVAADEGGRLLGWMHVEHRVSIEGGERAELMGLVVDSTARRRGIGRALVGAAEQWAIERGLPALTVRSNTARDSSHPFYAAVGYVRSKTQHVYVKKLFGASRESA